MVFRLHQNGAAPNIIIEMLKDKPVTYLQYIIDTDFSSSNPINIYHTKLVDLKTIRPDLARIIQRNKPKLSPFSIHISPPLIRLATNYKVEYRQIIDSTDYIEPINNLNHDFRDVGGGPMGFGLFKDSLKLPNSNFYDKTLLTQFNENLLAGYDIIYLQYSKLWLKGGLRFKRAQIPYIIGIENKHDQSSEGPVIDGSYDLQIPFLISYTSWEFPVFFTPNLLKTQLKERVINSLFINAGLSPTFRRNIKVKNVKTENEVSNDFIRPFNFNFLLEAGVRIRLAGGRSYLMFSYQFSHSILKEFKELNSNAIQQLFKDYSFAINNFKTFDSYLSFGVLVPFYKF